MEVAHTQMSETGLKHPVVYVHKQTFKKKMHYNITNIDY